MRTFFKINNFLDCENVNILALDYRIACKQQYFNDPHFKFDKDLRIYEKYMKYMKNYEESDGDIPEAWGGPNRPVIQEKPSK